MTIDKSELRRLSPAERIKKLKELEDAGKREIREIESLIKKSMQEMRTDRLAEKISPEQRNVEISNLFDRNSANEEMLERTARQEPGSLPNVMAYQITQQIYRDYSELKAMQGIIDSGYNLTKEQKERVGIIGERINTAERYIPDSEKMASVLNPSRSILYKLKKETGIETI